MKSGIDELEPMIAKKCASMREAIDRCAIESIDPTLLGLIQTWWKYREPSYVVSILHGACMMSPYLPDGMYDELYFLQRIAEELDV